MPEPFDGRSNEVALPVWVNVDRMTIEIVDFTIAPRALI
jgi:hypothetical protein